jgi:hypothetical protein
MGLETKTPRTMKKRLFADIGRQAARGTDGRIEQHRAAAGALGQPGGIKAAQ